MTSSRYLSEGISLWFVSRDFKLGSYIDTKFSSNCSSKKGKAAAARALDPSSLASLSSMC
jgi:hypothetical protein